MIGDRHVLVVRHQRIVGPEDAAGVGRVMDRAEEIGVVADRGRQHELGVGDRRRDAARRSRAARSLRCRACPTARAASALRRLVAERQQRIERGAAGRRGRRRGRAREERRRDGRRQDRGCGRRSRRRRARLPARPSGGTRRTAGFGAGNRRPARSPSRSSSCASGHASRRGPCHLPRKCFSKPLQHCIVVALQRRRLQRKARRPADEPRLEHEGERVGEIVRRQLGRRGLVVSWRGRGRAPAMQLCKAGAARREALRLGVVGAVDEAHELAHHVAVEPRRAERVLGHQPARREDDEIDIRRAGDARWARSAR